MRIIFFVILLSVSSLNAILGQTQTNNTITCSSCVKSDLHYYDGKPLLLHLNSVPLYYNPSFAGTAIEGKSRLSFDYKNKLWKCSSQDSSGNHVRKYSDPVNYHFSYDQLIDRIHAGIGIIVYKTDKSDYFQYQSLDSVIKSAYLDTFNQWIYTYGLQYQNHYLDMPSTSFYSGAVYSQKISIDQKITIAPALKIGYLNNWLTPGSAYYQYLADQSLLNSKVSYLDISTGILVNTDRFYAGFTIDHVNKPKVPSFSSVNAALQKLPLYIYQGGYTYQKNEDSKWALSCNLLYARQQKTKYASSIVNLSCKYRWASVGISSSSDCGDMLSAMFGMHGKNFTIGYSKNIFTRHYSSDQNQPEITVINTHEVSIKYLFSFKNKKKGVNELGN